ncbi:hypothetical protein HN670_00775 [bacterium]|jgi:hypothetical protein|nr:hypothetical protein [bacterium]
MDLLTLPFEWAGFWNTHFGLYAMLVIILSWALALLFRPQRKKQEAVCLWDNAARILASIISIFFWLFPAILLFYDVMIIGR